MKTLGIGLIGTGLMGLHYHGLKYLRMGDVRIRAVCDVDRRKAKAAGMELEVKNVFTEVDELLKKREIDVVDICVPTQWHSEYTVKAAEAGKHILCEKPIALDLKAADKMIRVTRGAGVKFMVAHVLRFDPAYATVRKVIDSGNIGMPLLALAARHSQLDPKAPWYTKPRMSGGVVVDMHIHDLDFFNWIFGHPKRIYSKGSKSTAHCWDHMSSLVYYPKGKACGEASWWWREANFPFSSRLSLLCERGGIEIGVTTSFAEPDVPMKERVWLHAAEKGAKLLRLPRKDGYAREIEYFVNCVKEDEEPKLCKPEDARLALELALAARQSAETETSVMLSSHKA